MLTLLLCLTLPTAETPDYVRDVHPILQAHCGGCHNDDDAQGDFNVATFASLSHPLSYLSEGPSLTPGRHDTSQFYRYMAGLDEPRMPPEGDGDPVPEADLEVIKAWLDGGAPGPDGAEIDRTVLIVPAIESAVAEDAIGITAMAAHGDRLAVARDHRVTLSLHDAEQWVIDDLPGRVTDLAFTADGSQLAIATGVEGLYGRAVLVDAATGDAVTTVQGHRDTLYAVAVSPDGSTLATAGYDRRIELWDAATGEPVRTLTGHNGAVFDLAFDASGTVLASASADETVKLWLVADGTRLDTLPQPEGEQSTVLFTADHVFAAGADNRIRRWAFVSRTAPQINPVQLVRFAHEGPVTHLVATGDAAMLVSASTDRSVKVWDAASLSLLASHESLPDVPASLAVAGGRIVVGLMDGQTVTQPLPESATPPQRAVTQVTPRLPETDAELTTLTEEAAVAEGFVLPLPATVTGAIRNPGAVDAYRFDAQAGEQWVIEAVAAQIPKDPSNAEGTETVAAPIDTVIEVRTEDGEPIERVVLEAVRDSYFTFRGKSSLQNDDFRIHNWQEMELNQLYYAGGEVVKFWQYPTGPDDGYKIYPGYDNRQTEFDTTPVAHALGEPAYIVRPHPAGTEISGTGLPVFRLNYRNDDAGSNRDGSNSRLTFTAPADGRYQVLVSDARSFAGDDHRYELTVRPRRPDFAAEAWPPNWEKAVLHPGSGREITVQAKPIDGYDGPVTFHAHDVPEGVVLSETLTVEPGQLRAFWNLYIEPGAEPSVDDLKKIRITVSGEVGGETIERDVRTLDGITFDAAPPKVQTTIHLPEEDGIPTLRIRPGETKSMRLSVVRAEGFKGIVEFGKQDGGRNLPHGLLIDNIGLNGLMLLKGQSEREFFVTASPIAAPQERMWSLEAKVDGGLTSRPVRVIVEGDAADEVAAVE